MIDCHDLDAFSDDLEAADRIVDRAKRGVPLGRHIMANEEISLIRAYALMRDAAARSADFMTALHAQQMSAMDVASPRADKTER